MVLSSRLSPLPDSKQHRGCFLDQKHHLLYQHGRAEEFTSKPGGKPVPTCWIIRSLKGRSPRLPTRPASARAPVFQNQHQDVSQASDFTASTDTFFSRGWACKMRSRGRWDSNTARACGDKSYRVRWDNGKPLTGLTFCLSLLGKGAQEKMENICTGVPKRVPGACCNIAT